MQGELLSICTKEFFPEILLGTVFGFLVGVEGFEESFSLDCFAFEMLVLDDIVIVLSGVDVIGSLLIVFWFEDTIDE